MTERRLQQRPDAELVEALRRIEPEIAWPTATRSANGADLASLVRARIDSAPPSDPAGRASRLAWIWPRASAWRPARHAVLMAVAILIALAALAGAAGVGLPGLRLFFGGGVASPPPSQMSTRSPTPGLPGAVMGLGDPVSAVDPAALDARAGFHIRWPADPLVGPPAAIYIDGTKRGQVSLVWAARGDLPPTLEPDVGLLLTEFRGSVDESFFGKVVGSGTTVEPAVVNGQRAYWLSGEPHFFFYSAPGGVVQDERRWVGDALIWSDGPVTYRLESSVGRDASVGIAESLP